MNSETNQPDITVIVTAHHEGLLVGPSIQSALAAMTFAQERDIVCELVVVLDRANDLTTAVLTEAVDGVGRIIQTDEGDPGQARNRGVEVARGVHTSFLDGDDLWSENWLYEAHLRAKDRPDAIFHSACNLVFGSNRLLFWHIDSECNLCDESYLSWINYWDSLCFTRTELLRRFPNRANNLALGFGHEDWYWNTVTLAAGIPHKPVPGTMHFKRAREGSQMSKVDRIGGFRWPIE